MPKDNQTINRSLFDLLDSKGYEPTMLDTSGKAVPIPEEAEVFQFDFIKDGKDYGPVTITIDGLHRLIIYYGKGVADSTKEQMNSGDESWYSLLRHLKRWAKNNQLSFELNYDRANKLKYDMAKRDHMKRKEKVAEGYYPMGKKASYNDNTPTVKMVIQHNREIQEGEQRYRNVARIFLENQLGERILAPTVKPGIASIYARHLAEGGLPHDERWNHINSLCEEYTKMAGFVRATRNGQFNESAQQLVNQGINHYQSLRESLSKMRGHRGYNSYFESYTPPLMEDDSEETNLNELFVQETLDPRIESVMPILNKLHKKVAEMKEVGELAEWADNLTEAPGDETLAHNVRTDAKNLKTFDLEEDDLDEQRFPDNSNSTAKRNMVVTNLHDLINDPRKAHEPASHGPDNPRVKMATKVMPSIPKEPVKKMVDNEVEEGMMDKVKNVASKVFDKLGGGSEEDLIKKLQKSAGLPQTGKKPEPKDKPVDEALDAAHKADQKINTPAVFRKAKDSFSMHKSNDTDDGAVKIQGSNWKVNKNDLAKADEKNMTSPAGMAALKKKLSNVEEGEGMLGRSQHDKRHLHKFDTTPMNISDDPGIKAHKTTRQGSLRAPKQDLEFAFGPAGEDGVWTLEFENGLIATIYPQPGSGGMDWMIGGSHPDTEDFVLQAYSAAIDDTNESLAEDEFAGDYATGEAGQWRNKGPKANKPATIGDLVGENFINTDVQAVVSEMDTDGSEDLARILNIAGIKK